MWFAPTTGLPHSFPNFFANSIPAQSAGSSPGPTVTAMMSIFSIPLITFPLSPKICPSKIGKFLMCSRLARFGTTPPKGICTLICEVIALFKTLNFGVNKPPLAPLETEARCEPSRSLTGRASTSAKAVSSHDVSIASIFICV